MSGTGLTAQRGREWDISSGRLGLVRAASPAVRVGILAAVGEVYGQVVNINPAPTSELDSSDAFFTVPALFDSIDRWWDNPARSSVSYDDTLGYPTSIESDEPEANDDHVRLLITEFEPA